MEDLEISAKTVEEAVQRALEELGVSRDEVEVIVLKRGKQGIFGLGAEEARVRVRRLPSIPGDRNEVGKTAREVLERVLSLMNLKTEVELKLPLEGEVKPIALDIKGEDLGILIGRRGQTLASLQHIVRLIIAHQQKAQVPISIDVEGYKLRRYKALRELALRLAQKVKLSQQPVTLEPMPANERRVIHLALADNPEVTTQSVGEEEVRKVVILPRKRQ